MTPDDLILVRCYAETEVLGFAVIREDEIGQEPKGVFDSRAYDDICSCWFDFDSDDLSMDFDILFDFVPVTADNGHLSGHYCWFSKSVKPHIGPIADNTCADVWFHALRNLKNPEPSNQDQAVLFG